MLCDYRSSCKCWMTIQVHYESVNQWDENLKEFDQYLSAPSTRIFKIDGVVNGWENPYEASLRLLTQRINDLNAKFIRDKSGLKLSGINQLILKMSSYDPLRARSWTPLPKFLANKKAIVNIKNIDNRCFGYAILYCIDPPIIVGRDKNRPTLYTQQMFIRNHLDDLPYPIKPNDVAIYEDRIQTNINVYSFFDDEGKARHPLFISKKNHPRTANLLYWNEHYAPINNYSRLFGDITKHKEAT